MARIDPALLLFAGGMLQNAGGGQGFGQSLGGALSAAGQGLQMRAQARRQEQQDLIANAQASVGLRAALSELQAQQKAQADQAAFVQSLPPELQAAAAVQPQAAAQGQLAAQQPMTPYQQAQLDMAQQGQAMDQERLALAQQGQEFEQGLAREKLDFAQAQAMQPAQAKLSDVSSLRGQYIRESADFRSMSSAYKKVLNSSPNAAGDLSLIFSYMKILDPTSVVRESEQATAANAASVPEQVRTMYNRVLTGEKLSPAQRKRFKEEAGILYEGAYEGQLSRQQGFADIAGRAGIQPRDITDAVSVTAPSKIRQQWVDRRVKKLGVSLSDLDETAQIYGLTHEQVLDQLEGQGG